MYMSDPLYNIPCSWFERNFIHVLHGVVPIDLEKKKYPLYTIHKKLFICLLGADFNHACA